MWESEKHECIDTIQVFPCSGSVVIYPFRGYISTKENIVLPG